VEQMGYEPNDLPPCMIPEFHLYCTLSVVAFPSCHPPV
jgi:hypothetical protein